MDSALVIAYQAVIMFILLFFGYFLFKKDFLSEDSTKQLSAIAIKIINPIVIFNSYQTDFAPEMLTGLLIAAGLAVVSHVVLILFSMLAVRRTKSDFETERFAISYSNCAFMGIPLVQATFGNDGVFYLTGYITVFNLFMWTHGVMTMQGGERRSASDTAKTVLKVLISPAILSIALGLVFFFTGLRLPGILQTPLDYLGALNTPLAMIVSGATIAKAGLLSAFRSPRVYYVQLFKLILVPAVLTVMFVPLTLLGVPKLIIDTILIAAAAPTASATIMFAYNHNRNAEYASNHFALSTIASMLTMPLVLMLSAALSGVISPAL